ncbi:MAG: acyltransferase family protein [Clostridiales bacterium]|nr:acyltransferase family protein [Clostridiales bacterium]
MEFTIVFYISLAILLLILLVNVSRRSFNEESFFDRVLSKEFQGFLAVFIIFHQTVITFDHFYSGDLRDEMLPFFNYYYYGILAVAFFFFSSGFGLLKRWMTDDTYIKGFMRRRIFTVLVPFFICNYIYLTDALLHNIRSGGHFHPIEVVCSFFGVFLINNQMWFAVEIMILYLIFRIVFAKIKKPLHGIIIMTAAVIVMVIIGLLLGHSNSAVMSYWFMGEWWYNTILMFPLGMLYAYKEKRLNKIFKTAFVPLLIASAILFVLVDFIHRGLIERSIYWTETFDSPHPLLDKLQGLSVETIFEIIFLVLVLTIMSRVKFGNPILKLLGKISLEMIMLNYLFCSKLYFLYSRYGIYVYLIAVFAGTVVSSVIVYYIKNIVLERRTRLFDGKVN